MKVIGQRVSILKKDNLLSIVILASADKKKLFILFLWLLAWSVCGVIVTINYFQINDPDQRLFIIGYLSFWAYFEFNIVRTFMWKKSGKEKLWIQEGILYYQRQLNKKGNIREYNLDLVSKLQLQELKPTRFADTINQSFWIKGGERLSFESQGKTVLLGMQLNDAEAQEIQMEVNLFIS